MGLRVRVVLVVLPLLAVAALAVPLALSLADRRTAELADERDRQLAALADAAAIPDTPLQRLVDRYYDVYGEGLIIIDSDGRTLASRGLDTTEPGVARRPSLSSTRRRHSGLRSCPGTNIGFWPSPVSEATVSLWEPSCWPSTPTPQPATSRSPGCGWSSGVWVFSCSPRLSRARSRGGCCGR